MKQEEEEAHTAKVKAILDKLTAEETQAQTENEEKISHQSRTLRDYIEERPSAKMSARGMWLRFLPESEGGGGQAQTEQDNSEKCQAKTEQSEQHNSEKSQAKTEQTEKSEQENTTGGTATELTNLQKVVARALTKQFSIPTAAAEVAATAGYPALDAAEAEPCRTQLAGSQVNVCQIDPADL